MCGLHSLAEKTELLHPLRKEDPNLGHVLPYVRLPAFLWGGDTVTADKLELLRKQNMEYFGFGPDAMKKVKVCSVCGHPSDRSEHFCVECGHRLPDKTLYNIYMERHRVCAACDTILLDQMTYCPQCGIKL